MKKPKPQPSYLLRRPAGYWNHGKRQLQASMKVREARRGGVRR